MRNISFALTTPQFLDGTKDVTRRMGWESVKVGDRLTARQKVMGFKKGEKMPAPLGVIEVISARREVLRLMIDDGPYGKNEVRREGFPDMAPWDFVDFFCASHTDCFRGSEITRIEFVRVPAFSIGIRE